MAPSYILNAGLALLSLAAGVAAQIVPCPSLPKGCLITVCDVLTNFNSPGLGYYYAVRIVNAISMPILPIRQGNADGMPNLKKMPVLASQTKPEPIGTKTGLTIARCCNFCRYTPKCVNWEYNISSHRGSVR